MVSKAMVPLLAKDDTLKDRSKQSRLPFSDSFIDAERHHSLVPWKPHMLTALSNCAEASFVYSTHVWPREAMESMPDVALIRVFRHLRPLSRVRSASLVCRRWHRLVFADGIWREAILMNVDDSDKLNSAKALLEKVGRSLRRLYVSKPAGDLTRLLPGSLINVTFFELQEHNESRSRGNELTDNFTYPKDLLLIGRFLPNLQCLLIKASFFVRDLTDDGLTYEVFATIFYEEAVYGRPWSLSFQLQTNDLTWLHAKLFGMRGMGAGPSFEHSQIINYFRQFRLNRIAIPGSVRRFSLHLREGLNSESNVVFMEVTCFSPSTDFTSLRELHKMEHLHVHVVADGSLEPEQLALFSAPEQPSGFPSQLRYLRLSSDSVEYLNNEIPRIAANCPGLLALSLGGNTAPLDAIVNSLRELRILHVPWLLDLVLAIHAPNAPTEALPNLRFVACEAFRREMYTGRRRNEIDASKDLCRSLFVKKPDLIVSVGGRFLSYRGMDSDFSHFSLDRLPDEDRVWEALTSEEGCCCARDTFLPSPESPLRTMHSLTPISSFAISPLPVVNVGQESTRSPESETQSVRTTMMTTVTMSDSTITEDSTPRTFREELESPRN